MNIFAKLYMRRNKAVLKKYKIIFSKFLIIILVLTYFDQYYKKPFKMWYGMSFIYNILLYLHNH